MMENHLKKLNEWVVRQVPRKKNAKAEALVGITAILPIKETVMLPIYLKVMPSIAPKLVCNTSEANSYWMYDIMKYLQIGELL